MMKCREVSLLLSAAQDRPLSLLESASLRLHLMMCKNCTHFARQLKIIRLGAKKIAKDLNDHGTDQPEK